MGKYIEQETNYAYAIRHSNALSFQFLRELALDFVENRPVGLRDELYDQLQRGVRQLQSEPEMNMYVCAFGPMHEAKLHHAFKRLPKEFLNYPSIDIIDYGCGQALGTICYADYLRGNKLPQAVRRVVLIEPSKIVLKRAALHASSMFPNAEVATILKGFDDLDAVDLGVDAKRPTLHIFSNVIDLADDYFDLEKFAQLIKSCAQDNNQFVCVGPYFDYFEKDDRLERFAKLLNLKIYYSNHFPRGTFRKGHDWSCNVVMGEKDNTSRSKDEASFQNLLALADKGDADAQYNLGHCYYDGDGVSQNYYEAAKWWRKSAEQGKSESQNNIGMLYIWGRGVKQDLYEATRWLRLAAEQSNATAQKNLGWNYYNGRGVEQNFEEAVRWYRKAADQGNANAQLCLGWCYAQGRGVEKDYKEAFRWINKAAEQGNSKAIEILNNLKIKENKSCTSRDDLPF